MRLRKSNSKSTFLVVIDVKNKVTCRLLHEQLTKLNPSTLPSFMKVIMRVET